MSTTKGPTLKLKVAAPTKPMPKIIIKTKKSTGAEDDGQESGHGRKRKPADLSDGEGDELDSPLNSAESDPKGKKSKSHRSNSVSSVSKGHEIDIPPAELKVVLLRLTQVVRQYTDKSGRLLATLFFALPSRTDYPDYYEFIKTPISLNQIQSKINAGKYTSAAGLHADIELLFNNAKTYNISGSQIYEDAEMLYSLFVKEMEKVKSEYSSQPEPTLAGSTGTPKIPHLTLKITKPDTSDKKGADAVKVKGEKSKARESMTPIEDDATTANITSKKTKKTTPTEGVPQDASKVGTEKALDQLFAAIHENSVKMAESALRKGVDPNVLVTTDLPGQTLQWTPLHAAAHYGRTKIIDHLVSQGARVEAVDSVTGSTPIFFGAMNGQEGGVKRLLRTHHANRFAKNKLGQTAYDVIKGNETTVTALKALLQTTEPKETKVPKEPKESKESKEAKEGKTSSDRRDGKAGTAPDEDVPRRPQRTRMSVDAMDIDERGTGEPKESKSSKKDKGGEHHDSVPKIILKAPGSKPGQHADAMDTGHAEKKERKEKATASPSIGAGLNDSSFTSKTLTVKGPAPPPHAPNGLPMMLEPARPMEVDSKLLGSNLLAKVIGPVTRTEISRTVKEITLSISGQNIKHIRPVHMNAQVFTVPRDAHAIQFFVAFTEVGKDCTFSAMFIQNRGLTKQCQGLDYRQTADSSFDIMEGINSFEILVTAALRMPESFPPTMPLGAQAVQVQKFFVFVHRL
ncbi:hypothetical protein HDU76_010856 [Blyttiomyces sp. JEL0837]|nr:hypothetical protein HDU76_010856 [Blyttiomyces sp. JEL0837]